MKTNITLQHLNKIEYKPEINGYIKGEIMFPYSINNNILFFPYLIKDKVAYLLTRRRIIIQRKGER